MPPSSSRPRRSSTPRKRPARVRWYHHISPLKWILIILAVIILLFAVMMWPGLILTIIVIGLIVLAFWAKNKIGWGPWVTVGAVAVLIAFSLWAFPSIQ